jgi:membrane associated rhomboid family serine protease
MADAETLGASGAISGVIGAYLVFFPKSKIKFMIWLIIFIRYFTLPSWGAIGFWIAGQILMARKQFSGTPKGEPVQVAVFAHLGGFLFGVLWAFLVRLFGKAPPKPTSN